MTMPDEERYRILKRTHQQLLRDWKRKKGLCIICAEREGNNKDHLPPQVLFPDFLFSVLLSFGLNQESIKNDQEPTDPDLLALYRQAQGHFHDPRESARRIRLLQDFIGKDPNTGKAAFNFGMLPVNQTLTKIVKSIYWLNTGGDILQRYNPGWWILRDVDTSKEHFIEKHLKTSHAELHWGDRFISHFTIGHPENGVGGFISSSLHFYTNRALGKGLSWLVIASPSNISVKGRSLYELSASVWGAATIKPQ